MTKKLSLGLVLTIWPISIIYLALLTNWFRYGFSLEAMFVAVPLLLGVLISSVFALFAFRSDSIRLLVFGLVAAGIAALLVIALQLHAFGRMPSLYMNDVEKSPTGEITTRQGTFDYWIELHNPFSNGHSEYIVIRRDNNENRFKVPIFSKRVGGYVSASSASDWGKLEATLDPDVYILIVGPNLIISNGKSFKINVRTGVIEQNAAMQNSGE